MLTALVSTLSNPQVFCWKNVSSFCKCKSYSHFFSKNISIYAIFDDQSLNNTLTNDIVSFEQLGPDDILFFIFTENKLNHFTNGFQIMEGTRTPYEKYTNTLTVNVLKFCTLNFLKKQHMQTVQTLIILLLKELSDQSLNCLYFHFSWAFSEKKNYV